MHKSRTKRRIFIVFGLAVIAVAAGGFYFLYFASGLSAPHDDPVFAGDSSELQATEVVATLDAPIPPNKNAIWCASFLAAWKTLETDLAKEPVALQGSPAVAQALNKAADPRPHIPEESLYVAAGWNQEGITDQINSDLAGKFPDKEPPTFPKIATNSFVAYAYLEADVKFAILYAQNRYPLVFTDPSGKKTQLRSFGIRSKDQYSKLRRQPAILHQAMNKGAGLTECVIDLDRDSSPHQLIVAFIDPQPTLAQMLASAETMIEKSKDKGSPGLGSGDVLLVPDMMWRIVHHFSELEGEQFTNANLKGQRIDVCQQDTQFRLGRSGAELKSEAKSNMKSAAPRTNTSYIFNRPFMLYMKKRGAEMPYFVMWIENAELLNKWSQ